MPSPDPTHAATADPPAAPDTTVGPAGPIPAPRPGPAADRYQLGDEIARGGMGAVFAARDAVLNRDVAVKVLHPRLAGTAAERRFVDEAHITGQLQHPGIPPVHDLGTLPDGRPFLAMKLIKGRTLDAVLKADSDRGRLLAVFEDICQAVGYAHAHGIVHRDLKPANVMVGAFGEVQVMDWGLAKLLGRSGDREGAADDPEATTATTEVRGSRDAQDATQAGSVMGTPAYMPPEQAIGAVDQIDARSDVFGLGAILCALLTGRPPFVGADAESTRQLAARGRVSDAFARLDASGAEPELVALGKRCLAPERDDRPRDAGEVATLVAGLRAAADDRARRAEVDRGRAEVRRRLTLRLGGLAVAVLLLGVAGTTAGLLRADRARRTAEAAEGRAAAARDRTRQALDAMTSTVTGDSLATQKEVSPEQKKFLSEVLTYHKEFAGEQGDDETTRARSAAAAGRVGLIHYRLGRSTEGVAAFAQARDGYARLAADFPAVSSYRSELASANCYMGFLSNGLSRWREAEGHFRAALALSERLAADFPAIHTYRSDLAACRIGLGNLLTSRGRWAEAEQAHRAAHAIQRELAVAYPDTPLYRHNLAVSSTGLGDLLVRQGKWVEAEEAVVAALILYERLTADDPAKHEYRQGLAANYSKRSLILVGRGKMAEAEAAERASLAIHERMATDAPAVTAHRSSLGGGYCNLGLIACVVGKPAESLEWYTQAIDTLQPVVAADPRQVTPKRFLCNSHSGRAGSLDRLARSAEAVPDWDRALELDDGARRGAFRASRATSRLRAGQVAEALAEVAELALSSDWKLGHWYNFACIYSVASGKLADKRDEYAARAVELLGKAVAAGYPDAAHMAKDTDLDPLRDRPDFRRLVADLAAKTRPRELAPPPRPVR